MGDIKQARRLATAATYGEPAGGQVPVISLADHKDGGAFDIHPLVDYNGDRATILMPHPDAPAYGFGLEVTADTAGRLGRLLVGVQRRLEGDPTADPE